MAVPSDLTVDDLDLPSETIGHVSSVVRLEAGDPVILYASKDDGKAELVKRGNAYRVTFEHYPLEPDAIDMYEVEWFDSFGGAVEQLATWMGVDTEVFLDTGGDTDG